ncbi:BTAD domain-containing putative transcriptional regulator [Streptomyces sp. NRRL S-495]|uniref:AfsR/SARP family transcriptional regulator n=1 Tax=Streptomyces sp. NRRL S-495 TaxID=1609133 RepID=UPI000695B1FD|nr:BTAD domain-containing putative transcriptional regulator [Streptomyces sp. NRRL S-495]
MGPIRASLDGTPLPLGGPQQCAVLTLLLIRAGESVPPHDISDLLWQDDPPATAANVVHHHISALRRMLEPDLGRRDAGRWLLRSSVGYRLDVDPGSVDLHVFRRLVERGRDRAARSDWEQAASLYSEALTLRRGSVGTGSPQNIVDTALFQAAESEYAKAVVEAARIHDRIGHGHWMLPLLQLTAERYPLDERLQAALVRALGAAGHQVEALDVYRRIRTTLSEELGIEPGDALRAAQTAVLRQNLRTDAAADPEDTAPAPTAADPHPAPRRHPHSAQLPPGPPVFVGRDEGLARILALTADASGPVIATMNGMAGIGKTALAVHAAHLLAERFPDGQLFVNLHGFDDSAAALAPADALRCLLECLGLPAGDLPSTLPGLTGRYRSLLTDRRVLIVLDNARDAQQVQPLLPSAPGCMTLVTSRNVLEQLLVTHNAHPVSVLPFSAGEGRAVLERHIGPARTADQARAVEEIVESCGGVPIALAVAAARASLNPSRSLGSIAGELRTAANSLEAFFSPDPDLDLRRALTCSYRVLDDATARLLRRLGEGADRRIRVEAAAALTGLPVARCRQLLLGLVAESLISEPSPGCFEMHRFVADYALEAEQPFGPPAAQVAQADCAGGRAHRAVPSRRPAHRPAAPSAG